MRILKTIGKSKLWTLFLQRILLKKKLIKSKEFIEIEEIRPPKQTIFDPRDTDLKMGKKGKTSWVGSKCHILETAEKGRINFITDMIYQKAHESDIKIHDKIKTSSIKKLFCDSNYMSGGKIKEYEDNSIKLMGYAKAEISTKPQGFKVADFKIDMKNKKARCPAKKKPVTFVKYKDNTIEIRFAKSTCTVCRYFELCVGNNTKQKRILYVTGYYEYLQKRRKEQKTDRFRNQMRVRAQVEGTISQAVRFQRLRYKKYKGVLGG